MKKPHVLKKPGFFLKNLEKTSKPQNLETSVTVDRATGTKCERCWNYSTHVGESERYPTVCERCVEALEEIEASGLLS